MAMFIEFDKKVNTKSSCTTKEHSKCPPHSIATIADENPPSSSFVNHGALKWNENRRKWIGNHSKKPNRKPKDPVISWSTDYEDLLSTRDPFQKPIPLSEMVGFLVEVWYDDDLYDYCYY